MSLPVAVRGLRPSLPCRDVLPRNWAYFCTTNPLLTLDPPTPISSEIHACLLHDWPPRQMAGVHSLWTRSEDPGRPARSLPLELRYLRSIGCALELQMRDQQDGAITPGQRFHGSRQSTRRGTVVDVRRCLIPVCTRMFVAHKSVMGSR